MSIYYEVHRLQQLSLLLISPARSCFPILFLNELRLGKFLKSLLSFDHRNGPKNLTECFP